MKILKQISTHKAIKHGNLITIYANGFNVNTIAPDGSKLFNSDDVTKYPHWFKDEPLYSIPASHEDDLFAIFERLKENNLYNLAEINA